jgi:uncharacterized protein (TIGR02118 family)
MMAKMIVIYNEPTNKEGFEAHYFNVHIPLVQKMPFIRNTAVHKVKQAMNTNENLYLIAELEFGDLQEIKQALESPEGKEVVGDVANLMPFLEKVPVITMVE